MERQVGAWDSREPLMPFWALGLGLHHPQQGENYLQDPHAEADPRQWSPG